MLEITARVSALAPEAASALQVIAHFDRLIQGGAGINAVVRGAAVLSGQAAEFVDATQGMRRSFTPDGAPAASDTFASPRAQVSSRDGSLHFALAGGESASRELDRLILERALLAAATILGRPVDARPRDRQAWIRVLIDEKADADIRTNAIRSLGLSENSRLRVIATESGPLLAESREQEIAQIGSARAGVGPDVPPSRAPESWRAASVALLLSAEGTPDDPGSRVVHADDMGSLIEITEALLATGIVPADVLALERAQEQTGWAYETVHAITRANSLRAAASTLHVHHSTVQERLTRLEQLLNWSLAEPPGRARAALALGIRRALRAANS